MKLTILEHTADFAFEVKADTFEGLVAAAVLACSELSWGLETLEEKEAVEFLVAASDREMALFQVLSEQVFLFETKGLIVAAVEVTSEGQDSLKVRFRCDRYDPKRHQYKVLFKAPTLHALKVTRSREGLLRARIVMDA